MLAPGPSAFDIQTHLYSSFLHASTYDVALRVSGSWSAIYKLHRVVLIQSACPFPFLFGTRAHSVQGFFKSLFTGGFSESAVRLVTLRNGTDEISVTFDDLNITRPAFEVCISRLYGGGPPLHVSPNLIPTSNYPLTPPFSNAPVSQDVPVGKHPASPRFLLSLLATAIYLSIPSIASQALSLVLKTIGPTTVVQYLNFACGRPIDMYSQEALKDPHSAVGLEHVAQIVEIDETSIKATEGIKPGLVSVPAAEITQQKDDEALGITGSSDSSDGEFDESNNQIPVHHYGTISNKIGEACACWLVRWATDMLKLEISGNSNSHLDVPDTRMRSKSVFYINNGAVVNQQLSPAKVPPIFGSKGLTAHWVAAIVSADTLFVKNERERYDFARSVVELRRHDGLVDNDESVWATMFERGIYYANMTFEDILSISRDVSPITKQPYVPLSILQASHWTQSVLRSIVTGRPNTVGSQTNTGTVSPPPREKELGVTLSTADILSKISDKPKTNRTDNSTVYYPVSSNSSTRIGVTASPTPDTSSGATMSMDELFSLSPESPNRQAKMRGHDNPNQPDGTEENFFGILTPTYTSHTCVDSDPMAKSSWSSYPPYRFSVEFWDVDLLKEKSRLYSQTIWYAGNLFNIYVQLVRKKGQAQLGIYLHRQSNVDPIPPSSVPLLSTPSQPVLDGNLAGSLERSSHLRQPSLPSLLSSASVASNSNHYSPSIHPLSRSITPSSTANNVRPSSSLPASPLAPSLGLNSPVTQSTFAPQQPYRDPRPSVSAYFAVSCASATGSSQTRFSSSPDVFSVSQSWGWKSSSLRTEDFVDVESSNSPNNAVLRNESVSIRATVLLGLV